MSNQDQQDFWSAQKSWIQYQTAMDACIEPVLDLLLEHANLQSGQTVLDIGCGTGASVAAIAQIVGPTGRVLGVDIAEPLLDMAKHRFSDLHTATFLRADAQTAQLPLICDAAVSRFGVMFFEDTAAAFSNIARGLNKGAPVTCAAWAAAPDNPFFMLAAQAAREVFGPMPKTDRSLPGPFAFENPDRVRTDFQNAGLEAIKIDTCDIHLTPPGTLEDLAELCMAIGPAASALAHFNATAEQKSVLAQALLDVFNPCQSTRGVLIPASIHIIAARTAAN